MIKMPREVNQALKILEHAGYEAWAAGPCVRESLMGLEPLDWDIICNAETDVLQGLFPHACLLGHTGGIRIDRTQQGDEDGIILDISTFQVSVADALKRMKFTVDAIADNPSESLQDPYGGRKDIREKLVRPVEDSEKVFEESPILMMEAVLLAAELDFDLSKSVYDAMIAKAPLLKETPVAARRETFKAIITAPFAGKGLRMLAGADLMPALIGEAVEKISARERELFSDLADGIHKLKPVTERRLGLFYMCFEKRGLQAIEVLQYDDVTHQHLTDAMTQMTKIYFIRDKIELKRYIYSVGMDRYDYVHNLAKAHRIVYPQGNVKVQNRHYMLEDILANKEPIFLEDLAIDAEDILEAGITEDRERAEYLLRLLPEVVHRRPSQNKKEKLLEHARKFSRNRIKAAFRGVKWLK